mgnify:CR=1 FL=1
MSKVADLGQYTKTFLGKCFGIGLRMRGSRDKHVWFDILVEDDGTWFIPSSGSSSYWMPELIQKLQEAHEWVEIYCEPDIYDKQQFGWKF